MLDQRDLALLHTIEQTISLNHVISAQALTHAWQDPTATAEWTFAALHSSLPVQDITTDVRAAYRDEVTRSHENARVRAVLLAKLYVETMAAYEDLGALCFTINRRKRADLRGPKGRKRTISGLFYTRSCEVLGFS